MPSDKPRLHSPGSRRAHLDAILDDALTMTFPASDPVAIEFDREAAGSAVSDIPGILAQAILSTRSDAIIAADKGGIIRFWNPGAERIFGFAAAEAIGQSLDIIVPERLRQSHWDGYDRAMQAGRTRYSEGDVLAVPARRKEGHQISIEFTVVLLRDGRGELVGIAALLRDVTKRFEEMRTLKRQLAAAVTGLGHAPNGPDLVSAGLGS
jgi:PAS domain S-box-containing protein